MMNELITQESEMVVRMLGKLERTLAYVEQLTENYRPILDGERYLTDREVAQLLKTSRRTLHEHRDAGRMAYIQLGGKIGFLDVGFDGGHDAQFPILSGQGVRRTIRH